MGWLWGALATFGLDKGFRLVGKLIKAVFRSPEHTSVPQQLPEEPELGGQRTSNLPGTMDACVRMLQASIGVLTHLGLLNRVGVPPPLVGAAWSWPQAWRSFRILIESGNQVAAEVLIIRTLGSSELADSAHNAAKHVARLMEVSNPTQQSPRGFVPQEQLTATVDALVAFRLKVRDTFEAEVAGRELAPG